MHLPNTCRKMPPRLVYLVTEDWYFISHRLPMAHAARAAGFDVHVATHVADHGAKIEAEGFELHPLNWRRGSLSPRHLSGTIFEIRAIYRRLKPDLAHHVALQAALVGSLAATGLPVRCVNAINGFGATFSSRAAKAQALRPLVTLALRTLINRNRSTALVQTDDDRLALERIGIDTGRIALIPGSGVDIEVLKPLPEPPGPVTVAFAGRLLEYKGIRISCCRPRTSDSTRPRYSPADCGAAGSGPSGLDCNRTDRAMEGPAGRYLSRLCRGYFQPMGIGTHRRAAVASRRGAEEPPGSRRLRTPDRRDRRARLPLDRSRRPQCTFGAPG